jgi:hypothetical protein
VSADTLRLRIEDPGLGLGVVLTDSDADGLLFFNGSIGAIPIVVSTAVSKPYVGGVTNFAELGLTTIAIATSGNGTLRLTWEDDDFTQGADGSNLLARAVVGGVLSAPAGSSVVFSNWVNPSNLVPDLGPDVAVAAALAAIGGIPAGSVGASFAASPGAFSDSRPLAAEKSGPYSLFSQAVITFTGTGQGIVSFDNNLQVQTPEPGTFVLIGLGLAGLATLRRRKT